MLLAVIGRFEFLDAAGHVEDPERYRARGYAMAGKRTRIVTDRPMEVVEVHAPSANSVNIHGVAVECSPPPAMD